MHRRLFFARCTATQSNLRGLAGTRSHVPAALMGLHPSQCCSRPRSPPRLRSCRPTCRFPSTSRPVVFTGSRPRDPVCLGHSPTSGPDRCDDHAHAAWVAVICPAGRARPSRLLGVVPAGDPPPLPAVFPLSAGEANVTALGFGPSLRSWGVRRRDTRDRRRGNPTPLSASRAACPCGPPSRPRSAHGLQWRGDDWDVPDGRATFVMWPWVRCPSLFVRVRCHPTRLLAGPFSEWEANA